MGRVGASKVALCVLNAIFTVSGLAIAAASIWFFCQVYELTSLRNTIHYQLDYKVRWLQAVPWIFFVIALFIIGVAVCGFVGAKKKSKGLLKAYAASTGAVVLLLVAAAVLSLVFADSQATDDFIKDTVWDVFVQSKSDREVAEAFGLIERKLHCCGVESPRDYRNWKYDEFPMSCCDTYYHGWLEPMIDCKITDKLPNERHGCSTVAAQYSRIVIEVLSAAAVFTAIVGIVAVAFAVALYRGLKNRNRPPPALESESKKVLL